MQVEPASAQGASAAVSDQSRAFIAAAAAGRLILPWCAGCSRPAHPGSETCPRCWTADLRWRRASGAGQLHSFVVFRRSFHSAHPAPYTVAIVELAEGPRLVGTVVGAPPELLHVGMAVVATFPSAGSSDETPPLRFRPARPPAARTPQTRGHT